MFGFKKDSEYGQTIGVWKVQWWEHSQLYAEIVTHGRSCVSFVKCCERLLIFRTH